jgi:2-methylisocitrate lyase-like PEP mutase family enzyme
MPTVAEKRRTFRALHEQGCFVLPNPWDVGSARYLQSLGFKALATTSSGAAWSMGHADGDVPIDTMLEHIHMLSAASDVPVNADFLGGFAVEPEDVAENVRRCVETGCAGLSIEDSTGDPAKPLFDFDLAVERIRAARAEIDATGGDTLLVGRAECFLTGHPEPLKEAVRRLTAYAEAGADCLYAPGVRKPDEIATIVKAAGPKPVNVVIGWGSDFSVGQLTDLGVRRISVGGAMARMAWGGIQRAAQEIAEHGTFTAFADAVPSKPLNELFAADAKRRLA